MPVGPQPHDLVVQVHTNLAAHGHHHGFAVLRGVARLEVGHQVGRHAGNARLRAHHFFKRRPFALQAALVRFFLVFGQLVNLVVDQPQVSLVQPQLGQPRLVVDGNRGAVFACLLHVVHVDVVTEHGARVAVFAAHRCAGEGHEGGMRQGIAQVLRVAHLVTLHRGAAVRCRRHKRCVVRCRHAIAGCY